MKNLVMLLLTTHKSYKLETNLLFKDSYAEFRHMKLTNASTIERCNIVDIYSIKNQARSLSNRMLALECVQAADECRLVNLSQYGGEDIS